MGGTLFYILFKHINVIFMWDQEKLGGGPLNAYGLVTKARP